MKKLMWITGFLAMSFLILPGCHPEGKDNNMNDAFEQKSANPATGNNGNMNDVRSRTDSAAGSNSYSDTSTKR